MDYSRKCILWQYYFVRGGEKSRSIVIPLKFYIFTENIKKCSFLEYCVVFLMKEARNEINK